MTGEDHTSKPASVLSGTDRKELDPPRIIQIGEFGFKEWTGGPDVMQPFGCGCRVSWSRRPRRWLIKSSSSGGSQNTPGMEQI